MDPGAKTDGGVFHVNLDRGKGAFLKYHSSQLLLNRVDPDVAN